MKLALALSAFLLSAPCALLAQSFSSLNWATSNLVSAEQPADDSGAPALKPRPASTIRPLSRVAFSGGISLMGVNVQAATNLSRNFNLRAIGNVLNYQVNNISTNGFNIDGKLNFATAGASLDYYPFSRHGFRLSPGVLFYNQNQVTANGTVQKGSSITLNDTDYYSYDGDPLTVNAHLGLNTRKQAFTLTTGWGNMISRRGGHWSFPVEIGAAFVGTPTIGVTLTGSACQDAAQTECSSLAANSDIANDVQTNLNAQVAKWKNDLDPLKVYPIISFGVAYNFRIR